MNSENDAQREQRVFQRIPSESGGGEFASLSVNSRKQRGFAVGEIVDVDDPFFLRNTKAEVEGVVRIRERGYVEVFRNNSAQLLVRVRSHWIEFHFAKGIGDLCDCGDQLPRITMNVVKRNRIERVTEDSWESY